MLQCKEKGRRGAWGRRLSPSPKKSRTFHSAANGVWRSAPRLEAELYIAVATNDASYPPEMAERLERALTEADVPYRAETYPAAHGWMKPDFPVFDEAAAERGWREMIAFFDRTLR